MDNQLLRRKKTIDMAKADELVNQAPDGEAQQQKAKYNTKEDVTKGITLSLYSKRFQLFKKMLAEEEEKRTPSDFFNEQMLAYLKKKGML